MKKGYIILIVGIILIIPVLLNFIIPLPALFPVIGEPINWLMFWATYLGAAASFGMIVYTALTLKQNKEQLDEMKRQWNENHKPNISVAFSQLGNVASLRLVNTSEVEIKNLKISGDFYVREEKSDFFDLKILESFNIDIEPHGVRNIVLHYNIEPLTEDCYFKLRLCYNGERKEIKVYCNDVYIIGDSLIWKQLIDNIRKLK